MKESIANLQMVGTIGELTDQDTGRAVGFGYQIRFEVEGTELKRVSQEILRSREEALRRLDSFAVELQEVIMDPAFDERKVNGLFEKYGFNYSGDIPARTFSLDPVQH